MRKGIAVFLLFVSVVLYAEALPKEIKYFVNIKDNFKGVLYFKSNDNEIEAKYYNISSRDKIPFYAPKKEFTLTTLDGFPTLKTLRVGTISRNIVYDLKSLSSDLIEDADINTKDIDKSAIIYDSDENLPSAVTEKRAIYTIEALISSIFKTKKIPHGAFYLYEPHKKMLMKVVFVKGDKESVSVGKKSCKAQTYLLKVANRNRRLIRVYSDPYPVKIEAFSKKWSFVIAGVGEPKEIFLSNKEIAFGAFKDEIFKKYGRKYDIKIISQSVQQDMFDKVYVTKFHIAKRVSKNEIKNYLKEYIEDGYIKFSRDPKDAFVFKVSSEDVLDEFEKDYDVVDGKYYWENREDEIDAEDLLGYVARAKECQEGELRKKSLVIVCDGDDEKISYKDAIKIYLKQKYKKFKLKGITKVVNGFDEVEDIRYKVKLLKPIENEKLYSYAIKALLAKYPEYHFPEDMQLVKSKSSWKIYISKSDVQKRACAKFVPEFTTTYKDGMCQNDVVVKNSSSEAKNILSKYLDTHYPDLKILDTEVQYLDDGVRFKYLNDLTKVQNGCK
ncbi:hypothetical protein MNB_SM-7-1377 [hydrothermal vent metagenome]|uniref:Uncharacterized protein n=1 Tax=hydrothermal vent metagenome TaxID=652676 RepID=A0A1W1BYY8_9ZZZZ